MDGDRFDQLLKTLTQGAQSRRDALRIAAATGAAGLLGLTSVAETGARHRHRKRCKRTDHSCNLNRPGKCCSKQCCFDTTSDTSGTCSSKGGTCCSERAFGGYCPQEFPICCGSDRCCEAGTVCCLLTGGRGACCDPNLGQVCVQGAGCTMADQGAQSAKSSGAEKSSGIGRMRAGS